MLVSRKLENLLEVFLESHKLVREMDVWKPVVPSGEGGGAVVSTCCLQIPHLWRGLPTVPSLGQHAGAVTGMGRLFSLGQPMGLLNLSQKTLKSPESHCLSQGCVSFCLTKAKEVTGAVSA